MSSPRKKQGSRQGFAGGGDSEMPKADDFTRSFLGLEDPVEPPGTPADIPIEKIVPDPIQPRRALPDDLRARWLAGEDINKLLDEWQQRVNQVFRAAGLPAWEAMASSYIQTSEDDSPLDEAGATPAPQLPPVATMWIDLARLAGSIHLAGLEQPVTVYQPEGSQTYRLIVGERRLLSFHLLNGLGYAGYTHIPAIRREQYSFWAQAFENGQRKNLNAISKARQLALLLMALNNHWPPLNEGEQPDQVWYAQAENLRVPYGKAEQVAAVLGVTSPRMLRNYRALLSLPSGVWNLADEHDWTEGKLRQMMQVAGEDSEQLYRIAKTEAGILPKPKAPEVPADQKARRYVLQALSGKQTKEPSESEKQAGLAAIEQLREELYDLELRWRERR